MHLVIPPIELVEIISDIENETNHNELSTNTNPIRSIKRKLIPKRKNKDEELEELVEYYADENLNGILIKLNLSKVIIFIGNIRNTQITPNLFNLESRVVYTPIISNSKKLSRENIPFYYPKVINNVKHLF